jgi:tRNA pseudouridine38-40 synthase
MARYQVILAYDGAHFHGSQRQVKVRTVQGVVERALRRLNWPGKSTIFAGRTDAGVHALGQVFAFDLDWGHSPDDLRNALNALFPADIAARRVIERPADFHPRYDALERSYRYRIYMDAVRNPLRDLRTWRVWPPPEINRLQAVARRLVGSHDFAAFGRPMKAGGSTIREVRTAAWDQHEDELCFEISANAFLYHMVRRLVYVQVEVGQGHRDVEDVQRCLKAPDGPQIQGLAPPQGLFLLEVSYAAEGEDT